MNKRGIAPVVSTVLLIIFATVLGLIVMSWGKNMETAESVVSCEETSVNIIRVGNEPCIESGSIFITVENNGELKINGFRVSIIGETGIEQKNMEKQMDVADAHKVNFKYDASVGHIQKIKVVPMYSEEGTTNYCPNNGIELGNIREC